jgi:hypothetical protein
MNILNIHAGIADLENKGILFRGKYYSCGSAIKNHWFLETKVPEITVYYAPDNLDFIYVLLDSRILCCFQIPGPISLPEEYLKQYYTRLNQLREQKAQLISSKKGKRKWL